MTTKTSTAKAAKKDEAKAPAAKAGKEKSSKIDVPVDLETSSTGFVTIPRIRTADFTTMIIGTAPLICHKFSEKLRKQILDKHMGEASEGRTKKNPHDNYMAARYRLPDGTDGVPAGGLKACIVDGFSKETGVPMTRAKGAIRVLATDSATNYVRIITPHEPSMREDVVRNDSGVVDIRHRPEYWPWAMELSVEFLPARVSNKQVLYAMQIAGFTIGLCEWRPASKQSKSGAYGTFRLADMDEIEAYHAHGVQGLWPEEFNKAA